jgi:hypothetical protein
MRALKASLSWVFVALALVGCNPSAFNSLLDQAPVASFTPPGSSTGSLFVLPLPPPADPGIAARMLVSRKDTDFLGLADFDMNGKVSLHEASAGDKLNLGGTSVYSAAVRSDGMILVGTPRYGTSDPLGGRVSTIKPTADGAGGYTLFVQGGPQGGPYMAHVGISVAKGNVTGLPVENFVFVGDNTLQVLGADGQTVVAATEPTCASMNLTNTTNDTYAFRPLAVGDLLAGGFDEIVVGGQGAVRIVQWNGTTVLPCPSKILTMSPLASFGSSVAVDDFDGDGRMDLAVGAPLDKVFVFLGPLDSVATPSVTITNAGATGFGQRVASFGLPGTGPAKLLVADPSGTAAGGRAQAGRVLLFDLSVILAGVPKPILAPIDMKDSQAIVTLFDSNSDSASGVFGSNLGGLSFNAGLCVPGGAVALVPWASTNLDVLTFFNYVGAARDPRCFAMK